MSSELWLLSASLPISPMAGHGPKRKLVSLRQLSKTFGEHEAMNADLPLGIRQNNPGNLRGCIIAEGFIGNTGGYAAFESITVGLANLMALSHNYVYRLKLTTLPRFLARYAPPSENDDGRYIGFMAGYMGIGPLFRETTTLNLLDDWTMVKFCQGISLFENGHPSKDWATFTQWFSTREAADAWEIMLKWNAAQSSKA